MSHRAEQISVEPVGSAAVPVKDIRPLLASSNFSTAAS